MHQITKKHLRALRAKLLAWFSDHGRKLPWRNSGDPYRVWISEIMLQQTQVSTVIPYYNRWMKAFPTVSILSQQNINDVLLYWQGLGYYSRAKNILATAKEVVRKHAGHFPTDLVTLSKLPGIGEYTAGAIISFAYGRRAVFFDTNIHRVISRLYVISEAKPSEQHKQVKFSLENFLPSNSGAKSAASIALSLMELGALVCKSKNPLCYQCPLSNYCLAKVQNATDKFPPRYTKIAVTPVTHQVGILVNHPIKNFHRIGDCRVLLLKRADNQRFGGLWMFPTIENHDQQAKSEENAGRSKNANNNTSALIPSTASAASAYRASNNRASNNLATSNSTPSNPSKKNGKDTASKPYSKSLNYVQRFKASDLTGDNLGKTKRLNLSSKKAFISLYNQSSGLSPLSPQSSQSIRWLAHYIGSVKHSYTRYHSTNHLWVLSPNSPARTSDRSIKATTSQESLPNGAISQSWHASQIRWVALKDLNTLPLSRLTEKIVAKLRQFLR